MNLTHTNKIGSLVEETTFFPEYVNVFPHNLTNPFNHHTLVGCFFQGSTCSVLFISISTPNRVQLCLMTAE